MKKSVLKWDGINNKYSNKLSILSHVVTLRITLEDFI